MKYVDEIELALIGKVIAVKQINFRESICKPCQELYDKGYIDTTKPMLLGNVLGSVRFSNYLPEEEVGEIIMRLKQYYDVNIQRRLTTIYMSNISILTSLKIIVLLLEYSLYKTITN